MQQITRLVSTAVLATASITAGAELVNVAWDVEGRFSKQLAVPAGKFVEVCSKLARGNKVAWTFQADGPLDFNVHYHLDKDVRFPAKQAEVQSSDGVLDVQVAQDYCWMWTNKTTSSASLKLVLERR